jgi:hypothetical protein
MATIGGSNIVTSGLVLLLDAANPKNFLDGEPTINVFPSPVILGNNRSNATNIGAIFTDFSTGSYNNGPFVRITRNVNTTPSPSTAWDFEYATTNPGYPDGTKHVFSFYARSIDGSTPTIKISDPDQESQTFNLTTQWQRFVGIFTLGIQASGYLWVRINRSNQQFVSGSSYDVSNAQIEYKSYATPFVSGSRTSWYDTSGNNISGSSVNGLIYSSENNGTLILSGVSQSFSLNVGTLLDIGTTTSLTFSSWINYTGSAVNYTGLVAKATVGTNTGVQMVLYNNKISCEVGLAGVNFISPLTGLLGTTTLNTGQWYNTVLAVDRSNNTVSAYVNGTLESYQTNAAVSTSNLTSGTNLLIGSERNSSLFLNGKISNVQVYNRALTAQEVLQNYNAQKSRYNL